MASPARRIPKGGRPVLLLGYFRRVNKSRPGNRRHTGISPKQARQATAQPDSCQGFPGAIVIETHYAYLDKRISGPRWLGPRCPQGQRRGAGSVFARAGGFPVLELSECLEFQSVNEDELRKRLEILRIEHRDLDAAIDALLSASTIDQLQIARLKKRKLKLKDQISLIEDYLIPDIIA